MLLRLLGPLLVALTLATGAPARAQQLVPVPALSGHVVDQAGLLDAGARQRLAGVLADYEAKSGSQIAVLIVKSTEPEVIEQFSIRVADAWKLGRKGQDDGVLLVVAKDNPKALRRLRIEAGRGVQGVLTDAQSKRVLQDVIAPHFRHDDYYGGLVAGTAAIAALLDKEQFAPPATKSGAASMAPSSFDGLMFALLMVGAGLWLLGSLFRRQRGAGIGGARLSRSQWGSGATGFIIGSILSNMANSGHRGGGGFGGGDSGGGFSGGGGGFDGGGASGDW